MAWHGMAWHGMARSINAGVVVGNVKLYLSQSWETRPLLEGPAEGLKKVVRYNESSTVLSQGLQLSASTVARMCGSRQSCYFIVGVFGVSTDAVTVSGNARDMVTVTDTPLLQRSSTFTLMYSSSADVTDLVNLVSIDGQCEWNKPQFYRYVLTQPSVVRTNYYI
jgi:hypothetical protein